MRYFIYVCALCLLLLLPRLSGAAEASWWNDDWSYRKPITLDTTGKGANITQPAGRMPLLIRLHPGNFQFDGVSKTGSDLRFIGSDGKTPLNYQIESFDPVMGVAQIWLDVPDVPNNGQQTIWMYYGNNKAPVLSSGPATFDADYTLIYHFDEQTGMPPTDATAYGNTALSGAVRTVDGGIAGNAAIHRAHRTAERCVAVGGGIRRRHAGLFVEVIDQGVVGIEGRRAATQDRGLVVAVIHPDRLLAVVRHVRHIQPDLRHAHHGIEALDLVVERRLAVAADKAQVTTGLAHAVELEVARVQADQQRHASGRLRDVGTLARGI